MGFKIDEIVHPEAKVIARQFDCNVCLCISDRPVQTVCGHIFCQECVKPLWACPTCRTAFPDKDSFRELEQCNKPMQRLLHELKVWCPYHEQSKHMAEPGTDDRGEDEAPAKRAKTAGQSTGSHCRWEGSYADLLSVHLPKCQHHLVPCPKGCGMKVQRALLGEHEHACSKNFEKCPICQEQVKRGELEAHRDQRAKLHAQLLEAQCADLRERISGGRLEQALELLKTLATHSSELGSRLEALERGFERQTPVLASVRWAPGTWEELLARYPVGRGVKSAAFRAGTSDFTMTFYPNGWVRHEPDPMIYLSCTNGRCIVTATLSTDGEQSIIDEEELGKDDAGFSCDRGEGPAVVSFTCEINSVTRCIASARG